MDLKAYISRSRDLTGYWGSWPPSYPIEPGWVGSLDNDGVFRYETRLDSIDDISAPSIRATRVNVNEAFYDQGSTTFSVKANADMDAAVGAKASGEVTVSFADKSGLLIAYVDATYHQVEDIDLLKRQIKALVRAKKWPRDRVVIVETVSAKTVTVLTAAGSKVEIRMGLKGDVNAFAPWQLASAGASIAVKADRAVGLQSVAKSGTPLYRTLALRRDWIGRIQVDLAGADDSQDEDFLDLPWTTMDGEVGV